MPLYDTDLALATTLAQTLTVGPSRQRLHFDNIYDVLRIVNNSTTDTVYVGDTLEGSEAEARAKLRPGETLRTVISGPLFIWCPSPNAGTPPTVNVMPASRSGQGTAGPAVKCLVSNRTSVQTIVNSGLTIVTWSSTWKIIQTCNQLSFMFDNFAGKESPATESAVLKASVKIGSTTYPLFFRGARLGTMDISGSLESDPIAVECAAGSFLNVFVDYDTTVASGTHYLTGSNSFGSTTGHPLGAGADGGTNEGFSSGVDVVDAGTVASAGTGIGYGPTAIYGFVAAGIAKRGVIAIGDSTEGYGTFPDWQGYGPTAKACNALSIPFLCLAVGGERCHTFVSLVNHYRRMRYARQGNVKHATVRFMTNDVSVDGTALASAQADIIQAWFIIANCGLAVYPQTIPPYTTASASAYTVAGDQALGANEAKRVAYNRWLRAGAPMNSAGVAVAIGTAGALVAGMFGHPATSITDGCAAFETDINNVVTLDGGYWQVPSAPASANFTATSGSTTAFNVSGGIGILHQWRGYTIEIVSGTGAGRFAFVTTSSTTGVAFANIGATLDNTSVGRFWACRTNDGTHMQAAARDLAAAALPNTLWV